MWFWLALLLSILLIPLEPDVAGGRERGREGGREGEREGGRERGREVHLELKRRSVMYMHRHSTASPADSAIRTSREVVYCEG